MIGSGGAAVDAELLADPVERLVAELEPLVGEDDLWDAVGGDPVVDDGCRDLLLGLGGDGSQPDHLCEGVRDDQDVLLPPCGRLERAEQVDVNPGVRAANFWEGLKRSRCRLTLVRQLLTDGAPCDVISDVLVHAWPPELRLDPLCRLEEAAVSAQEGVVGLPDELVPDGDGRDHSVGSFVLDAFPSLPAEPEPLAVPREVLQEAGRGRRRLRRQALLRLDPREELRARCLQGGHAGGRLLGDAGARDPGRAGEVVRDHVVLALDVSDFEVIVPKLLRETLVRLSVCC